MTGHLAAVRSRPPAGADREVALIDLLDRLLQGGVAIQGDIVLSAGGVDLVELDLRLLVAAVDTLAAS
ncbi:MAG: gas vesicle protein [Solirubrobacteraceae bacterium]